MKREDLLIVGYGRFGRLLGSVLRSEFRVSVLDRTPGKVPRPLRRVTPAEIGKFQVVILALPVHRLEPFLRREGNRFKPGAFVADVSALKDAPLRWMARHLPSSVSFAGLHPLFGPDSAGDGLPGHSVVVCRGRSSPGCHRRLIRFLRKIGLNTVETNPATHDKIIASTLFLTQWVGEVLPRGLTAGPLPFETPSVEFLRLVADRAQKDRHHILRDLCRFSPHCAKMLRRLTTRTLITASRLARNDP